MPHYVAIVEEGGPEKAVGVWFPDLPGCFSAGDDIDEALHNAQEALALYADSQAPEGRALPLPLFRCMLGGGRQSDQRGGVLAQIGCDLGIIFQCRDGAWLAGRHRGDAALHRPH